MEAIPAPEPMRRLGGIDVLRLGAMLLVTIQHVLSLTGHTRWSSVRSLNIGQLGVAIFLGISAQLASTSRRPPARWLAQRLMRLYPAYWLAMIGCFTAARVARYKPFGIYQFLSQMLGLGQFTHPDQLINVATWFISIVLVCYAGLFIIRLSRWPLLVNLLLVAAIIAWLAHTGFHWAWIHFITFFAMSALVIGCPAGWRDRGMLVAGIGILLCAPWSAAFAYTGLSLLLIGAASGISAVPRLVTRIADCSYEYYLIHGPCLILTISALRDDPAIAVASGIALAALGAVLLNRAAGFLMSKFAPWTSGLPFDLAMRRTPAEGRPHPASDVPGVGGRVG